MKPHQVTSAIKLKWNAILPLKNLKSNVSSRREDKSGLPALQTNLRSPFLKFCLQFWWTNRWNSAGLELQTLPDITRCGWSFELLRRILKATHLLWLCCHGLMSPGLLSFNYSHSGCIYAPNARSLLHRLHKNGPLFLRFLWENIFMLLRLGGREPPYKTLCVPPTGLDLYISFRILFYQTMTSLLIVSRWGRGGVFVAFSAPRPRPDWFMLRLQQIIKKGAWCHVDGAFGHPLATDFPGSRSPFCRFLRPPSLICFSFLSACSFSWLAWHHSEPPSVGHNRTEVFSLSFSLFTLFSLQHNGRRRKKGRAGVGGGGF